MSITPYQPQAQANGLVHAQQQRNEPRPSQVQQLAEWAQAAQAAYEVSQSLVQTSFVPEGFRNKPYEATAAILAGSEVGLSPMASLRAFDVIQGTAAPRAITLRAIVQSQGHEVWIEESTDSRAIVAGRRAGSGREQRSVWTMDRARGLGLTSKHNWKAQPQAMLIARATSEVCRLIASDAILGLPYSVEEISDGAIPVAELGVGEPQDVPPEQEPARRTAKRRAATPTQTRPEAAPRPTEPAEPTGPPLPGEDEYDDTSPPDGPAAPSNTAEPADPSDRMTQAQQRKLFALLREAEIDGRDERFAYATRLLGHEITSYGQLSITDAGTLIDNLEAIASNTAPGGGE